MRPSRPPDQWLRHRALTSYAEFATELIEALERSRRHVEVSCAAATVALDAADAGDLCSMGEAHGTAVLILDWTPTRATACHAPG
ncbi:hypothetical protein mvi_61840 (plasmid) [Methylobacterium indicum]|uniref:Uncharacterized protein n=1 Tax=Methylobacterium indicum TaxID=1775910 RepID=A0A8H9C9Y1_9HYPH|nr:hypothetical protein mvi_61840 [Methylobacterium indicum]